MEERKFYICRKCGNIVGLIHDSKVEINCCGQPMEQLVPGSVDASVEKHVPHVAVNGDVIEVQIGSTLHPSIDTHWIPWVYLQTEKGGQRKNINPGEEPKVAFKLIDDKPVRVYAYCNLHGLWVKDI
ncbi:desulfoferrodoxin [bacterium]|nr:desulfoferrodoxin [bacterium]